MNKVFRLFTLLVAALALGACDLITINPVPGTNLDIVINEVNTDAKYIELYNRSEQSADIGGLTIIKNNEGPIANIDGSADFVVAEGTVLPAKGFAVIGCKGNTNTYEGISLGTSKSGISGSKSLLLELVDKEGNRLDYFVNTATENPTAEGPWDGAINQSFDVAVRIPDGSPYWYIIEEPTHGAANGGTIVSSFKMPVVNFGTSDSGEDDNQQGGGTVTPENPGTGTSSLAQSVAYVWDDSTFPEITLKVSEAEWNNMLKTYDQNSETKQYFKGDVSFFNGTKTFEFNAAGWRLRGNTSRRRPEGNGGIDSFETTCPSSGVVSWRFTPRTFIGFPLK